MISQFFIILSLLSRVSSLFSDAESELLSSLLDHQYEGSHFIHMVEFGGYDNFIISNLSKHDAVVSWSVITHDWDVFGNLKHEFEGSMRVTVKMIPSDFSVWNGQLSKDTANQEEGTYAEYEKYIDEIVYFGAKDNSAYWVASFGKAKVDVGIAALPLLSRTGGYLLVSEWESPCYVESLLQFYDLVELVQSLAVLKPKTPEDLLPIVDSGYKYDWCFAYSVGNVGTIRHSSGPSDTQSVIQYVQNEMGCSDVVGGRLYCKDRPEGECLRCYAALMAITKRGHAVRSSIDRVLVSTSTANEL
mmetsp:Transcript_21559/g.31350  ORF Transcript_21559/g.31350 Transcript_21559/m.31350 type:complete len:302 (+) Transcript_21559:29-934(+)